MEQPTDEKQPLMGAPSQRSKCIAHAVIALTFILAVIALVVASVGVTLGQAANTAVPLCDVSGYYKCVEGSFCVGTQGALQGSDSYFTTGSNGIEFDRLEYLASGGDGEAPAGQFVRMEIHGGCSNAPCSFHEQELYTPVPGTLLNWEGFTVNRTGAADGDQVFYENLYFQDQACDKYVKIVKGQLLPNGVASGVLCHNECSRTTADDYAQGIKGGYTVAPNPALRR